MSRISDANAKPVRRRAYKITKPGELFATFDELFAKYPKIPVMDYQHSQQTFLGLPAHEAGYLRLVVLTPDDNKDPTLIEIPYSKSALDWIRENTV